MKKTILAFDTTMSHCSVSLLYNQVIYNLKARCDNNHSEHILPMINQILHLNSIQLKQVDIIAFSKGPGKFSGTRMSISIAIGLSLGTNIPLIALSSLLIMAEEAWELYQNTKVLAIIKINKEYMCIFQYIRNKKKYWEKISKEKILNFSQTVEYICSLKNKWIMIGNGLTNFPIYIRKKLNIVKILFPKSKYIINLICSNKRYQKPILINDIDPIYLSKECFKKN